MLGQLRTIGCLAVLVSLSSAESPGDKCSKEGDMLGITNDCKEYLICEKGQYVSKSCGFWQEFDIKHNECRWSPLATCRQKTLDDTVLDDVTDKKCSESGPCKSKDTTSVESECHYYCTCEGGVFKPAKRCKLDRYYDPIEKICTLDSTVCKNTPTTQEPTTVTGSEPTTVTGSESTTVTGSEPSTSVTSSGTTSSPPSPDCSKNNEKKIFKKGDCKDYLECDSGKWVKKSCSWGYDFDINKLDCTWSWWAHC